MNFYDSSPSTTEAEILSQKLGRSIPADLKDFLLKYNGGQPEHDLFKGTLPDGTTPFEIYVNCFLGIDPKDLASDIFANKAMFNGRIPHDLLPIAHDGIGNVVCIVLDGDLTGKICVWWHDVPTNENGTAGYPNIDVVCNSLPEFLSGLIED
jgi:hypothetical protein